MNRYLLPAMCLAVLSGCSSIPKDAFLLTPSAQDDRQMESRVFVTRDEATLLKEGAVILGNMGYKTEMVDPGIGLVTATKREENGGFVSTVMSVLSAGLASSGNQTLSQATFTTLPAKDRKGAFVTRLTLHKITLDSDGNAADAQLIIDKDVYKIFYERLEASTFIEPDRL